MRGRTCARARPAPRGGGVGAAGHDPSFLLRGARLEQAEAWVRTTDLALGHEVRRYVAASITERTKERDGRRTASCS